MTGKDKVSQIEFKFDDSVPSYVREQLQDPINRINQHIVDLYSISNVIPRTVEITSDPMRANSPRLVEVDKITGKALYENPRLGGLTVGNKIYIAVPPLYGEVKQYPYSFLHEFRHVTVPGTAGPNDPHYASWYDGLIEMKRILNVVPHDTDVMYSSQPDLLKCFTGDTSIQLEGGNTCYIRDIRPGDIVLAYDSRNENRYNSLVPRRVTHLFNNITTEWVVLTWQENDSSRELTCTPGHHFLDEFGNFPTIADILKRSGGDEATIVLADGQLQRVSARRIVYSAETAHLYERASKLETPVVGGLALSPIVVEGWATYNFEVEDLHTYVAGGVRVHNTSNPWTHESTKEKKDVAVTEAAIRHGVPEDYAIALGKGSLGVEELGGSSGSGVTKGSNSSTSGGGLVSYSTSGRAISLDRQTYDSYISSHGGDRATANSRVEAAVTAAVAAGKSYKDAMAAGMGEARAAGLGTSDWSTSRTAENAYNAAKEAAAKQQKTQSSSTSGSSGKGSGSSANTAPSGQTSGSGSSSSGSSGKGSGGSGSNSSSSPSSSGSGSSGGSSGKGHPVLLDLDGDGFDVTRLDQSSVYFDIGGDGYKHRTAWAGAGDGVLMVDADGDGVISNRKEVIFTDWDPTADSDIEALRQVFDTDKNGVLDASDADWSKFKVMVTRPDGTTVAKTMAELGIRSIKLTTDETRIALSDGSSIDGVTSYTKTDGSTGQAATATLMVDSRGYAVSTTSSTDGAGAVTVTSKALTSDGSLAEEIVRTTTADGLGVTTRFDSNGDGVIDRVLTDVTTVNADGSRQRVETNKTAAGVLIDKITTATSADRKTITIDRDKRGGGWTTERETQVTGTDNSLVVTLAALAPSASTIAKTTTTMSADRLLRSVAFDLDGNGTTERTTSDQTVINSNGSRVETESVNAGTGALLAKTVTSISADGQSRTETIDSDGDGLVDLNVASSTVRDTAGTATVTETRTARSGGAIGKTVTTTSRDGLTKTSSSDLNSDSAFDRTSSDVTTVAADGTRTQVFSTKSANGTLLSKTTTVRNADGLTRTTTTDANGDGATDRTVTVAKSASSQVIETTTDYASNGTSVLRAVKTTSADGRSTRTETGRFVSGAFEIAEVGIDTTVKNSDGSSTETVERRARNNALIDRTVTNISANGLTQSVTRDINGDGAVDASASSVTVVNADASQVKTVEARSGNNTLLSKSTTTISADRRSVITDIDADGDGKLDGKQTTTVATDGSTTVEQRDLTDTGVLQSRVTAKTSANGLVVTTETDADGDGTIDRKVTDSTSLSTDGSSTRTVSSYARSGALLVSEKTWVAGDGFTTTGSRDRNGDGTADETVTSDTTFSADGSTKTVTSANNGTSLVSKSTVTVSGNGLSKTIVDDIDGNTTTDRTTAETTSLNADGSTVVTKTVKSANNTLIGSYVTTTTANALTATTTVDLDGNGQTDLSSVKEILVDGSAKVTVKEFNAAGSPQSSVVTLTSADGLTVTTSIDSNNDGTVDRTRSQVTAIGADGAKTTTSSEYSGTSTLTERSTSTVSANGLTSSIIWTDGAGARLGSVEQATVIAANGDKTETSTYRKADSSVESKVTTTTSGNGNTVSVVRDVNGDGKTDQTVVTALADDGTATEVSSQFQANGTTLASRKTVTLSANRLVKTTLFDADGNGAAEKQLVETTVLNADGSTTATTVESVMNGSWQVKSRTQDVTSGNGLSRTTSFDDTGGGTYGLTHENKVTLDADGTRRTTDTWKSGSAVTRSSTLVESANRLTSTLSLDNNGDGTTDQTTQTTKVLNADGSTTVTSISKVGTAALSSTVTTTSADGRTVTIEDTSAIAGVDGRKATRTTRTLADGSTIERNEVRNTAGLLIEATTTTTSDDKRLVKYERDVNGDGTFDQVETRQTTIDGRLITTTENRNSAGTLMFDAGNAMRSRATSRSAVTGSGLASASGATSSTNRDKIDRSAVVSARLSVGVRLAASSGLKVRSSSTSEGGNENVVG